MPETAAVAVLDDRGHFLAETAFGAGMVAAILHDQRGVVQDVAAEGLGLVRSRRPVGHLPAALGQRARQHGLGLVEFACLLEVQIDDAARTRQRSDAAGFLRKGKRLPRRCNGFVPREVRLGNRDRPCNALVASSGWSTLGACNSAAALRNSGSALAVSIRLM